MNQSIGALVVAASVAAACSSATSSPTEPDTTSTVVVSAPPPSTSEHSAVSPSSNQAPWSFVYSDGSGNQTKLSRGAGDSAARFTYSPVTPERSSSGLYSGGDPAAGAVDEALEKDLLAEALRLEAATGDHQAEREKGTGQFFLVTDGKERTFIVQRKALEKWQALVDRLRGK